MKPKPTRRIESLSETVHVEKVIAGGLGFARKSDGEPVFLRGAVPGDRVELQTLEKHKGYSRARQYRLTQPSPARRLPPCEYQPRCGGCDLMALETSAQRAAKHAMVLDILHRTAKLDAGKNSPVPLSWRDAPQALPLGYRSRIRMHISKQGQFGFKEEQSHEIVEVARCLVANPAINEVIGLLTHCAELHPRMFSAFEQVEIRALGEHPDLLWYPREAPAETSRRRAPRRARPDSAPNRVDPTPDVAGEALATLRRSLGNLAPDSSHWLMSVRAQADSWRTNAQTAALNTTIEAKTPRLLFAPGMFTQVNWKVNQTIIEDVLNRVAQNDITTFLDLYCGAGNFSLPLLGQGLEGLGIESSLQSIAAAQTASSHQELGGRFVSGDVATMLTELTKRGESFDLVLLDPPRAGFKDAAAHLPHLARKAIFICSCDPTTFARDVRTLLDLGFLLDSLTAYDMFPQTHHVELTAWLRRETG